MILGRGVLVHHALEDGIAGAFAPPEIPPRTWLATIRGKLASAVLSHFFHIVRKGHHEPRTQ